MTAIVLPDIDRSTIEELKKRIPDLSEIELNLPSRKEVKKTAKGVSKTADETIDRLLGRKRAPVWPWIAAGLGLLAIAGVVAAWFAWFRRPTWESQQPEPWSAASYEADETMVSTPSETPMESIDTIDSTPTAGVGGTATPRSTKSSADPVGSAPYPIEEA
jgi:hypothetical protein